MKKVNEKLISTLATERLIADSAAKTRGEGSPTSTNSSTSTLKGDESAENIPGLVQDQSSSSSVPASRKDVPTSKDVSASKDTSTNKDVLPDKNKTVPANKAEKDVVAKRDSTDRFTAKSSHSHSFEGGHSYSFEGPMVITRVSARDSPASYYDKSTTLDRRNKLPLTSTFSDSSTVDYASHSLTLDRRRETRPTDRESVTTTTTGRTGRVLSKQKAEDLLALDPKTIQSLERLKKLTASKRPKTPEPLAPSVTDVKLMHSPERRRRRKSEGMHSIEKQVGSNFLPKETLHEGDEHAHEHGKEVKNGVASVPKAEESKKSSEETKKESSKPMAAVSTSTTSTVDSESKARDVGSSVKNEAPVSERAPSPVKGSQRSTSPLKSSRFSETEKQNRNRDVGSPVKNEAPVSERAPSPVKGSQRSTSPLKSSRFSETEKQNRNRDVGSPVKNEAPVSERAPSPVKGSQRSTSPLKSSRFSETEKQSPTSSSSKYTNPSGDRSPTSPKKRISSSSSNEEPSSRPTTISSLTRSTPVDRMWSDFKKEDDGSNKVRTSPRSLRHQHTQNSTTELESPRSVKRRFVTREAFLDDTRSSFKIKSSSARNSAESSPLTSRSSSPSKNQPKEDTEVSLESRKKVSTPQKKTKEESNLRTKSPPGHGVTDGNSSQESAPKSENVFSKPPDIVVRSPSVSVPESRHPRSLNSNDQGTSNKHLSNGVRVRQKSPVSDLVREIKSNRRMTPVISEDALDAILRGDIPEDELTKCPLSPSQTGDPRMTLETCLEEEETPKDKTPTRRNILKSSNSPEQTPSPHRSPEKKVTINSEPCVRRVNKPMLSPDMRERTKSLSSFSPERSLSPPSPREDMTIPEEDNLSKSTNLHVMPISRLRTSSLVMSRSTPDLSEILGPKKKDRKARRVERSNSKRRSRVDTYVTSTTPNSTYNPLQSSGTFTASRSSSRLLSSGSRFSKLASAFSRKDKDHNERDSSNRHSEKGSKRW